MCGISTRSFTSERTPTSRSASSQYADERPAAAGIAAARRGELPQAAQLLEKARMMSTGPLAEGLDGLDGLEGPMLERERLYRHERFLADMEVRAELELELGRHRNAVPYPYYAVDKYPRGKASCGC
ncbi:BTAD domain-containing putative transcriptional regulator [Streptomyces sp. NPDC099050]|uniref:BTAD domain-containing putative transcriptional regulator n=1 Tax=Streptomyces sp. NPDC099050 TaxID=3366100 RepID=UPI003809D178